MLDAFVAPDIHAPGAPTGLGDDARRPEADPRLDRQPRARRRRLQRLPLRRHRRLHQDQHRPRQPERPRRRRPAPGTTYGYQVSAVDTAGLESPRSATVSITTEINPVGQGTYENDDPAVTLNGAWTKASSVSDSGGSSSTLSTAGYAELSFNTSGIRWITRLNNYSGIADVYLDGVKKTTVDLYSSTTKTKQVAYEVTGLPETPHTIRIVRTGTKNPSSYSPSIMLDAFVAPDIHAPLAPAGLTATITGADVQLAWSAERRARPQGLPGLPAGGLQHDPHPHRHHDGGRADPHRRRPYPRGHLHLRPGRGRHLRQRLRLLAHRLGHHADHRPAGRRLRERRRRGHAERGLDAGQLADGLRAAPTPR